MDRVGRPIADVALSAVAGGLAGLGLLWSAASVVKALVPAGVSGLNSILPTVVAAWLGYSTGVIVGVAGAALIRRRKGSLARAVMAGFGFAIIAAGVLIFLVEVFPDPAYPTGAVMVGHPLATAWAYYSPIGGAPVG